MEDKIVKTRRSISKMDRELTNDEKEQVQKRKNETNKLKHGVIDFTIEERMGYYRGITYSNIRAELKPNILPFKDHKDLYKEAVENLINHAIKHDHFDGIRYEHRCRDMACRWGGELAEKLGLIHTKKE